MEIDPTAKPNWASDEGKYQIHLPVLPGLPVSKGMRGYQGCFWSLLPQMRRLFAQTTAIAILTLT